MSNKHISPQHAKPAKQCNSNIYHRSAKAAIPAKPRRPEPATASCVPAALELEEVAEEDVEEPEPEPELEVVAEPEPELDEEPEPLVDFDTLAGAK